MKRISFILIVFMCFCEIKAQNTLPSVTIRTLDGRQINTSELHNDGKPFIISFWATWCRPCITELTAIADVYYDWQEETGVKLFAINTDDSRTSHNVMPFISGRGWEYDFYLDVNGDFKRAMNVNLIPHTFILNGAGEVVWQHTSFTEGGEYEMLEIIKDLVKED